MNTPVSPALSRSLCAAAAVFAMSLATPAHGKEQRQLEAHEHGHGALDVVAEGHELVIELRVPGVNVVGFEHEPETDQQRRAVDQALTAFRQASKLFVPSPAARCEVEQLEVSFAGETHHEGESHGGHSGAEQHAAEGEAHAELRGEYHFHCAAPENLDRVEVRVFEHLKDADELEVRLVTPATQTAVELRPGGRTTIDLRP